MTRAILPGLQVTLVVPPVHHVRLLATSALPDAPVVTDDDISPRRSPGAAKRAFAAFRG